MYNLFLFHRCSHKLLLDTGAEKAIFFSNFISRHNFPTFPTETSHLILANDLKLAFTAESSNIIIRLGLLGRKIKGDVCLKQNVDIIAGFHWLRQLKPVFDWVFSLLNVSRNDVN